MADRRERHSRKVETTHSVAASHSANGHQRKTFHSHQPSGKDKSSMLSELERQDVAEQVETIKDEDGQSGQSGQAEHETEACWSAVASHERQRSKDSEGSQEGWTAAAKEKPPDVANAFDLGDLTGLLDSRAVEIPKDMKPLKERLLVPTEDDEVYLQNMLADRIKEGQGEFMMEIGLQDDGSSMGLSREELDQALATIGQVAQKLDAAYSIIYQKDTPASKSIAAVAGESGKRDSVKTKLNANGHDTTGHVAYIMIRQHPASVDKLLEIRVAVVGNVDAGKSTLLGVLTKNVLDDGRGKARVNLFRHKHEVQSGRTSSVGMEILGFDNKSVPITHVDEKHPGGARKMTWDDICHKASKVLSFIDLAGHERYLKTTVFGMTGFAPDFVMLMIGANAGIIGMTKEHLGLALSLSIPVFVVITKIDMCPANVLEDTIKQLTKILKSPGCRKIPMFVKTEEDVVLTAQNFVSERLCPIFQISNVTGEGLDYLRLFMNVLPAQGAYDVNEPFEFQITDTFSVPFVGTVVSGVVMSGVCHTGDNMLIGPDSLGHFERTSIRSIQRKRVNVPIAYAGQSASFALKKVKRSQLRKGMVMLSAPEKDDKDTSHLPKAYRTFEAEVLVLYHSTTIGQKYQAMLHCGNVRQTARISHMDTPILRTGDRARVQFEFIKNPEYLKLGSRLIFREGRTKGIGKVTQLLA
ncbi:hypothetical protein BZG36_01945 [Bifiguratus adelaidae]|uniref:Tr-type G domain-containing protein n=1 Tax=Bifiguratus adelaidae TaxID=1938954 RepID=A0A261Y404_9FUNG|nr:hypothetical protein BZG36_01945 [Bifiguratus adelaidae]